MLDDSLDRLRLELNQTFEFVAIELPRLAEQVSQVVSHLGLGRENASRETFEQLIAAKSRLQAAIGTAVQWMLDSRTQLDDAVAELRPGISYLRRTLGEVRSGAGELRILALNASFVAQRGDVYESGRRGFAAATKELIQIAAEQMREAEVVLGIVDGATEQFAELQAIAEVLTQLVAVISTTATDSVLEKILDGYSAVEFRMTEIVGECDAIASGIGRTMVAIQRQDILRQGLNHIELVEKELKGCEATLRAHALGDGQTAAAVLAAVLQRRCGQLCADLLEEIRRELDEFLAHVESHLHQLIEVAATVRQVASVTFSEELHGQVRKLCDSVARLEQSFTDSTQAQVQKAAALEGLSAAIQPLPGRLRMFVERQEQIRTLGILIRRQDARSRGLAGANTVGDALQELLLRGESTWTSVLADVTQIRTRMRVLAGGGSTRNSLNTEPIVKHLAEVEALAHRASREAEGMTVVAGKAVRGIEHLARDALARIYRLRNVLEANTSRVERYRRISASGEAFVAQYGAVEADVELPERLRELIQRFTILSHKRLAGVDDSNVEAQEDSGSVTLF